MIDYVNKTINVIGKEEKILKMEVWFATVRGLVSNLDAAIKICTDNDLDPNLCIQPVCVMISDQNYEATK